MILSFVLPVAFFSIFAGVFAGGTGRAATRKIPVAVVDEDGSSASNRFVTALAAEEGLKALRAPENKPGAAPFTRTSAEAAVRSGDLPVAIVVRRARGDRISFGESAVRPRVEILSDSADPIAPQVLGGLVQKVAMTAMPASMARSGMEEVDRWSGGLTPEQKARMEEMLGHLEQGDPEPGAQGGAGPDGLITVETRDLIGEKKKNPTVAFYPRPRRHVPAFSAAGAGGALIEEAESGTLDRSSRRASR